jgi:hypothetical protein
VAAAPFDRVLVRELARVYARAAVDQLLTEAAPVRRDRAPKKHIEGTNTMFSTGSALLNLAGAAQLLSLSIENVVRLCEQGALPHQRDRAGRLVFRTADVLRLVHQRAVDNRRRARAKVLKHTKPRKAPPKRAP